MEMSGSFVLVFINKIPFGHEIHEQRVLPPRFIGGAGPERLLEGAAGKRRRALRIVGCVLVQAVRPVALESGLAGERPPVAH